MEDTPLASPASPLSFDQSMTTEEMSSYEEEHDGLALDIIATVIFAIIFVVGIVGNGTLIFIVLLNKPMRTMANVLIVSLAMGDFLLILVSVPLTLTYYITSEWCLGDAQCKVIEFLQTMSLGVSIFTLTALSVDRFIAIVYPLTSYSSSSLKRVVAASVLIWVMSVGLAMVDLVGAHVTLYPNSSEPFYFCNPYPEEWGESYRPFRVVFRFVIFFALPTIIIFCLYVIIAISLLRESESLSMSLGTKASSLSGRKDGKSSENAAMIRQIESRKKVAKVVLSFAVIFIVCWLPRHVYVLYANLNDFHFNMGLIVFDTLGCCVTFINSCLNPMAPYLLNNEYRRYYHHYLLGCCYKPFRLQYSQRRGTVTDTAATQTLVSNASLEDLIDSSAKGTPEIIQLKTSHKSTD